MNFQILSGTQMNSLLQPTVMRKTMIKRVMEAFQPSQCQKVWSNTNGKLVLISQRKRNLQMLFEHMHWQMERI